MDNLGTPVNPHHLRTLFEVMNLLVCTFRNVWDHIVGAVNVHVKPACIISGGVGSPPSLQGEFNPPIDFLIAHLSKIIHTATVSHMVPFMHSGMGIDYCFLQIQVVA